METNGLIDIPQNMAIEQLIINLQDVLIFLSFYAENP
jgi:hypothetical protein